MKKCPYCAEEIQDEAIICRYCGRELSIRQSKKRTGLLWIPALLIVFLLGGIARFVFTFILAMMFQNHPSIDAIAGYGGYVLTTFLLGYFSAHGERENPSNWHIFLSMLIGLIPLLGQFYLIINSTRYFIKVLARQPNESPNIAGEVPGSLIETETPIAAIPKTLGTNMVGEGRRSDPIPHSPVSQSEEGSLVPDGNTRDATIQENARDEEKVGILEYALFLGFVVILFGIGLLIYNQQNKSIARSITASTPVAKQNIPPLRTPSLVPKVITPTAKLKPTSTRSSTSTPDCTPWQNMNTTGTGYVCIFGYDALITQQFILVESSTGKNTFQKYVPISNCTISFPRISSTDNHGFSVDVYNCMISRDPSFPKLRFDCLKVWGWVNPSPNTLFQVDRWDSCK